MNSNLQEQTKFQEYLKANVGVDFKELINKRLTQTGLKPSEVYKRAGADKRAFSKIFDYSKAYKPGKFVLLKLCIAMRLTLDETVELLESINLGLGKTKFDYTIRYCYENNEWDVDKVSYYLDQYGITC